MDELKNINCNLCGANDYKVVYEQKDLGANKGTGNGFSCSNDGHGEYYRVVRCNECGLRYCSPRPDLNSLAEEYSAVEDERYKVEIDARRRLFKRNLNNISRFISPTGKMLEVGCALGIFMDEASKVGWDVKGLDPSKWYVDKARELFNVEARLGSYKDLKSMEEKFDCVAMWDVLEHLDDPLGALVSCRDVLKDEGMLVFSTVDIGSFYARVLGKKWPWLMKMHIYYFDKKTIKKYLEKAGLKLIKIRRYKHVVSLNYLIFKLKKINRFLCSLMIFLRKYVFFGRDIFITVCFGDFMEVYATKCSFEQDG